MAKKGKNTVKFEDLKGTLTSIRDKSGEIATYNGKSVAKDLLKFRENIKSRIEKNHFIKVHYFSTRYKLSANSEPYNDGLSTASKLWTAKLEESTIEFTTGKGESKIKVVDTNFGKKLMECAKNYGNKSIDQANNQNETLKHWENISKDISSCIELLSGQKVNNINLADRYNGIDSLCNEIKENLEKIKVQ